MAELTFSFNIAQSHIGLTPSSILTAGVTYSVDGVTIDSSNINLYVYHASTAFSILSPDEETFSTVGSFNLSPLEKGPIQVSSTGTTINHFFGVTLYDPVNGFTNDGFIISLINNSLINNTNVSQIKLGCWGFSGTTNHPAAAESISTNSLNTFSILSASNAIAGSTLGLTLESSYVNSYYVGIGTGSTFFGIFSLLGCTSGNTLSSVNLTTNQINSILSTYFSSDLSDLSANNTLRNILNPTTSFYKISSTEFVVPPYIPSGSYYIMPIPRGMQYGKDFSSSYYYTDANNVNLPRATITITNNNIGVTQSYQINPSGVTFFDTNKGPNKHQLFSFVDSNYPALNTPTSIYSTARNLFSLPGSTYGITQGLLTHSFNAMDYGNFIVGITSQSTPRNYQSPIFGFIPSGLTIGETLSVLLDGITFYQKIYNPFSLDYNTDAEFGVGVQFNNLKYSTIFDSDTNEGKLHFNNLNKAFFRVDFNNFANPWGFTGFTFSSLSGSGHTLNVKYWNSGSIGSSYNIPIRFGSPAYIISSSQGVNAIDINGSAQGITLIGGEGLTVIYNNRPFGYLEKLNIYSGGGTFVGGLTLFDNRRINQGSRYPTRDSFGSQSISTIPSSWIPQIGTTGTARVMFERVDGLTFEFASSPISTLLGAFDVTLTRGNLTGITILKNYSGDYRDVIPAVDLMRITVNHSISQIPSSLIGLNRIHTRYWYGGNVDNNGSGSPNASFFNFIAGSFLETVSGTSINVSNRRLESIRSSVTPDLEYFESVSYPTPNIPLRTFEFMSRGYPSTSVPNFAGNGTIGIAYNYFDADPRSLESISSVPEDAQYWLRYREGITLIFDIDETAAGFDYFPSSGLSFAVLNNSVYLTPSTGLAYFLPGTGFNHLDAPVYYAVFALYDYQILGATLSKTINVGSTEELTLSLLVKDLPPQAIFDGLLLNVYNGFASIFTKNLFYNTSSTSDYRIPNYNTFGNTLTNYYTATPLEITQIFVGSGSSLGGITISPPSGGWPASSTLRVEVTPIFKSFIDLDPILYANPSNNYFKELTFTTAAQTTTGGGGGGSSSGSVSVSESVVTGVAFTSTENDFYAGFLCGTTAYNIITNNSTASYSVLTSSSTAYANAKAAFDAGSLTSNTSTDVEIHSLLNYMDYGGNIIVSPTIDGLLGSNYEYDIVFTEDNKRYGELMRIGSEKNHAIVVVGTSLEEDAASFAAPAYTNLNSAGLVDGLTYMTTANKGEYVFSVLGYKNRTRFYGSGIDTVRLYLSSDVAGAYARSYVENKYHLSSSGSARGGIRTYSNITPTIVDRDLSGYYTRGINPIYIPSGTNRAAIWGDATGITTGNEAYRKSASVSKNTSTIKREFKKIFEDFQFEQNNAGTRAQFVSRATTVLDKLQSVGGLASYTLICNETNNTPSVVAQKRLVVDLTIVPNNSIESIVLNFVLNQI